MLFCYLSFLFLLHREYSFLFGQLSLLVGNNLALNCLSLFYISNLFLSESLFGILFCFDSLLMCFFFLNGSHFLLFHGLFSLSLGIEKESQGYDCPNTKDNGY